MVITSVGKRDLRKKKIFTFSAEDFKVATGS